jgi:hypothetical protein
MAKDLQAEMEKYQAEIMKIQGKYAADPSPENILKTQQEMAELSQKMAALSMQIAGGAMGADMFQAMSAGEDEDDEELKQFILDNPPPPGKAKYLPLGALLLVTNGEPCETFAMTGEQDDWAEMLEQSWDIKNAEQGRKMLSSLLKGRHEAKFGEDFRNFKAGKDHELDDDSAENYNKTLDALKDDCPALLPSAKKCETLLAWDLDRAAYLARIFTHLEWIDEAELFKWMEKTAEKAKASFSNWKEYYASLLIGRAVAYSFDYQVIGAAYEIFEEKKDFLKSHPFSEL